MYGRLALGLTILLAVVLPSRSLTQENVPARAALAAAALRAADWKAFEPGLDLLRAETNGALLTAIRIDLARFRLDLAMQDDPDGERVEALGQRHGAVLAINGGFFGEKEEGKGLYPVGLLRVAGVDRSSPWRRHGGFLALHANAPAILPSAGGPPADAPQILQSKPVLIESGGRWAMNKNRENLRRRSLVCLLPNKQAIILVVTGVGLSLFEAGWLMRREAEGGFFGCDSAIALDGGGSTQLWLRDHPNYGIRGETPVHNALLVRHNNR
jgi:hypothetical protein